MNTQNGNRKESAQQSRFFDALLCASGDGIVVTDSAQNIVIANDAFCALFDRCVQDLIKTNLFTWLGLLDAAAPERWAELERCVRLDGLCHDVEFHIAKDETEDGVRRFSVNASLVRQEVAGEEGDEIVSIWRDVTERERAETALLERTNALQESEQRFRSFVEQSSDGILLTDERGIVVEWNRGLERITGLKQAEVLGQTLWDAQARAFPAELDRPSVYERVKARALESLEGGQVAWLNQLREVVIQRPDGTRGTMQMVIFPIETDKGFRIGGILRDVTERRLTEENLRESERRLQSLYSAMTEGLCLHEMIYDESGAAVDYRIIDINPAYEEITGFTRDEAVGSKGSELYGTGEPPYLETCAKVAASGEPDSFEAYFSQLDKHFSISVSSPGKGKFVTLFFDITERKWAEVERDRLLAQVREQAQRVQRIMDMVPEGVLLLDAGDYGDAHVHWRVVLANPLGEGDLVTLAGAKVGDAITHLGGRPLAELLTSPPKGLWHQVALESRFFQILARSIETGPMLKGWVLVIRDMTSQHAIERRVRQQERLAAVGQLAAGIAHDFSNVMATIVLYAQMTARVKDLSPHIRERMVTINRQALHATNLIRQILDFSRSTELERRALNLVPFLKEQVKLLERTLPENIKIGLFYKTDEYTVNADPTSMQQAVMNLAINARDAMPDGGSLYIRLERIQVESLDKTPLPEMETGEWVRLTVSDTGTGILPKDLPHIFEPFFTTKELGQGTGLGLAQVHGIVGAHDGVIGVESQVNEGTTFIIFLPVFLVRPVDVLPPEIEPLAIGEGKTILVVEDNAVARRALVESMELLNYRVLEAADGRDALALLTRHSTEIALVLSDVVMPGMGGVALLDAMREKGIDVGVVMLTGHSLEDEMEELRAQGMIDWLPKPPSLEQLAKVTARALAESE